MGDLPSLKSNFWRYSEIFRNCQNWSNPTGFDCLMCLNILQDPRALPCGHSFCGNPKNCHKRLKMRKSKVVCFYCDSVFSKTPNILNPVWSIRNLLQAWQTAEQSNGGACQQRFHLSAFSQRQIVSGTSQHWRT